jgi:hypothetical protein
VAPVEFLHQRANQVRRKKRKKGDSQRAAECICNVFHGAFAGIEFAEGPTHVLDIRSALIRGLYDTSGSIEQVHPEFNFKIDDPLGESRL